MLPFFFIQSYVIAIRYNTAFLKVEDLSSNLEAKVKQRTAQLAESRAAADRLRRESEGINRLLRKVTTMDDIDRIMAAVMDVVRPAFNINIYSLYAFDRDQMLIRVQSMIVSEWLAVDEVENVRQGTIRTNCVA